MGEYVVRYHLTFEVTATSEKEAVEIAGKALEKMDGALEGHDPYYEVHYVSTWFGDEDGADEEEG